MGAAFILLKTWKNFDLLAKHPSKVDLIVIEAAWF